MRQDDHSNGEHLEPRRRKGDYEEERQAGVGHTLRVIDFRVTIWQVGTLAVILSGLAINMYFGQKAQVEKLEQLSATVYRGNEKVSEELGKLTKQGYATDSEIRELRLRISNLELQVNRQPVQRVPSGQ